MSVVRSVAYKDKRSERSAIKAIIECLADFPISIYIEYYLLFRVLYLTSYLLFVSNTIYNRSLRLGTKYILSNYILDPLSIIRSLLLSLILIKGLSKVSR